MEGPGAGERLCRRQQGRTGSGRCTGLVREPSEPSEPRCLVFYGEKYVKREQFGTGEKSRLKQAWQLGFSRSFKERCRWFMMLLLRCLLEIDRKT